MFTPYDKTVRPYFNFIDGNFEAQVIKVTCPKSQSWKIADLGFRPTPGSSLGPTVKFAREPPSGLRVLPLILPKTKGHSEWTGSSLKAMHKIRFHFLQDEVLHTASPPGCRVNGIFSHSS